nr:hypothetical protein [Haliscomenobacter sp.]
MVSGCDASPLKPLLKGIRQIITAGIYEAPSIKVAEAAKVIENIQRDLNISLVNELAMVFDKMDIDTNAFWLRRQQMEFSPLCSRVGRGALYWC